MPFDENYSEFFDTDDFADNAVIRGRPVAGIFERQYIEVLNYQGYYPTFICPANKLLGIPDGEGVHIDGDNFTIATTEPDGTGLVLVVLTDA